MPRNRSLSRPVIVGIVGDSGAGKTTLSRGIAAILGSDRVVVVCSDDYHCLNRAERRAQGITALNPAANHLDILEQHIGLLREGKPVLKPVYDHKTGSLVAPDYITPRDYVIVEGLLGYATKAMRDHYDVKVFLDPEEALRQDWMRQRDITLRGYSEAEVAEKIARRENDKEDHIDPQRTYADVVVRFHRPKGREDETGRHLNARHTLRPTLPHPDLTPVLERTRNGIRLELTRDIDGKPVDVLEIEGDLEDDKAQVMENHLWSLIPEASHLRGNLGQFHDANRQAHVSHALALSQLLISFHLVKAALGHYAV